MFCISCRVSSAVSSCCMFCISCRVSSAVSFSLYVLYILPCVLSCILLAVCFVYLAVCPQLYPPAVCFVYLAVCPQLYPSRCMFCISCHVSSAVSFSLYVLYIMPCVLSCILLLYVLYILPCVLSCILLLYGLYILPCVLSCILLAVWFVYILPCVLSCILLVAEHHADSGGSGGSSRCTGLICAHITGRRMGLHNTGNTTVKERDGMQETIV